MDTLLASEVVELAAPPHVPAELIRDFDIYGTPEDGGDYHAFWRAFQDRAASPLVWTPRNGGHWIATKGSVISEIYQDSTRFSSSRIAVPTIEGDQPLSGAVGKDPPFHGPFRVVLNNGLSPKAVRVIEPQIRALAANLIEAVAPRGECEFISQFADVLPLNVF